MEILCVYKFTGQLKNVDMLNKLKDIPLEPICEKRTGNGLEEKSDIRGQQKQEGKITLRGSKCCKVRSFKKMHHFLLNTAVSGCHANH